MKDIEGLIPVETARHLARDGERTLDVWAREHPEIPVLALVALGFQIGKKTIQK